MNKYLEKVSAHMNPSKAQAAGRAVGEAGVGAVAGHYAAKLMGSKAGATASALGAAAGLAHGYNASMNSQEMDKAKYNSIMMNTATKLQKLRQQGYPGLEDAMTHRRT